MRVPLRKGLLQDVQYIEADGPVKARPDEMMTGSSTDPASVWTSMRGSDDTIGHLLVVAPMNSDIMTVVGTRYTADGRIAQDWVRSTDENGVAVVEVPRSKRIPANQVKVRFGGRMLYQGPSDIGWASGDAGLKVPEQAVQEALDAPPARVLIRTWPRNWCSGRWTTPCSTRRRRRSGSLGPQRKRPGRPSR